MQWVLPGGAELNGDDERAVACRPLEAVQSRTVPARPVPVEPLVTGSRLTTVKLWVELLVGVVALIAALLALFGLSRN